MEPELSEVPRSFSIMSAIEISARHPMFAGGYSSICRGLTWLTLLFLLSVVSAFGQNYGPPCVGINGWRILPFQRYDADQDCDIYSIDGGYPYLTIDGEANVVVTWSDGSTQQYQYNSLPGNPQFTINGNPTFDIAGISADQASIIGTAPGVVYGGGASSVSMFGVESHQESWVYRFTKSDSTYIYKFAAQDGEMVQLINFGSPSPWYLFAVANGDLVIAQDSNGNWPPTNAQIGDVFIGAPMQFYCNGISAPIIGSTYGGGGPQGYWQVVWYQTAQNPPAIFTLSYGMASGSAYAYMFDAFGNMFNVDPATWKVLNPMPGEDISLVPLTPGTPNYGPAFLSYSGSGLPYAGAEENGSDLYTDGSVFVTIKSDRTTVAETQGTYVSTIYHVDSGAFDDLRFVAVDLAGNPVGLPPGVVVLTSNWLWPISLALDGGDGYRVPATTFRRPDGAVGAFYPAVPDGAFFLPPDQNGFYGSSLYRYSANAVPNGVMVVDDISGNWPASNVIANLIFVNNVPWQLVSQQPNEGGNFFDSDVDISGQATYAPTYTSAGGGSLVVSWGMSGGWIVPYAFSGLTVSGVVQGAGQLNYSNWDGASILLNKGVVISLAPITRISGPEQIDWNGMALQWSFYDTAAALAAGRNVDVYHDEYGLGLSATIDSQGNVTMTPAGGGASVTGLYNAITSTFTMGAGAGSVYAMNSQGAVIVPGSGPNQATEVLGNFDIQGNLLSFGNWTNSSNQSVPGLQLTYSDLTNTQPAMLNFEMMRQPAVFSWSHASSDNDSTLIYAMQLDQYNRLMLMSTDRTKTTPTIVLDPSGSSVIKGPLLILPQGDLDMGIFQGGETPGLN